MCYANEQFVSQLAILDNRVFAGSRNTSTGLGTLYCFEALTGNPLWQVALPGPVFGSAVAADPVTERIYVGTDGSTGTVLCFPAMANTAPTPIWTRTTSGGIRSSLA